jgi:hypothetical protein
LAAGSYTLGAVCWIRLKARPARAAKRARHILAALLADGRPQAALINVQACGGSSYTASCWPQGVALPAAALEGALCVGTGLGADHALLALVHVYTDALHVAVALQTVAVVGAVRVDTFAISTQVLGLGALVVVPTCPILQSKPGVANT